MSPAAPAWVHGAALASALGNDLDAALNAVGRAAPLPVEIAIEGLDEPLTVHFQRIADGAPLFAPERLRQLLPAVIQAALGDAGLDRDACRTMPIVTGSSCFSVRASEAAYAAALVDGAGDAVPMPVVSYPIFADLARRVTGSRAADTSFNTACTSSANALLAAQRLLAQGRATHALVLGVELANRTTLTGFAGLQLLGGRLRPFDAGRRGIVLGEAVAAIVLGPRPGPRHALALRGGASNCDTHSLTANDPDGHALTAVQRRAMSICGIDANDITLVKAHATGTPANDRTEARSLRDTYPGQPPVVALKAWLGHTLGACGAAELALLSGSLRRGFVPATAGFQTMDPELGLAPVTTALPAQPGFYALNHFGFGGSNTVLVAEWT